VEVWETAECFGRRASESTSGQFKACSDIVVCAQSRASGSTLDFLTFMLVRANLLQEAASRKYLNLGISHFHPLALSSLFRNLERPRTLFKN